MTAPAVAAANLTDPGFHATGDPHELWRWMRRHAPILWHEPGELPGFWSLTRWEDIRAVYRNHGVFSSARGVLLRPVRQGEDPGGGQTLALTDPPRHHRLRGMVADWFSARSVRSLEDAIRATVTKLLDRALEQGRCEFVQDVAARLSHDMICGIIGVPQQDREMLFDWTNEAFGLGEPSAQAMAHQRVLEYFLELMYQRMEEPADDLISTLVNGKVDGELLTEQEIFLNCENIMGATENGRLSLIGGVQALAEFPGQWRRLASNRALLPSATEEILRWTSSATHSMRTATEETVIHGQRVRPGERVVLWLPSANRDEDVFADPYTFDVARDPNRHIALGAGAHFCVGGLLARAETRILLEELLDRAAGIELDGPVEPVHSIAVAGAERLALRLTPA